MRRVLALMLALALPATAQEDTPLSQDTLTQWLTDYRPRASEAGISDSTLDAALPGITFLPRVIELDGNQNEFSKTIWEYLETAVSEARIASGRAALQEHRTTFDAIEEKYGVDRHIVAAIWGLESAYGAVRGDTPTLSALATLAHEGRRGAFFEAQLTAALAILEAGDTTPDQLQGSWAGAMGHTQFMPGNFDRLAVDFDGDGRRDIWGDDPSDALASTAAFLVDAGWSRTQPWGLEVTLPDGFDYNEARRKGTRLPSAWAAIGVQPAEGATPFNDQFGGGSILLPGGADGPAFLIFDNFAALERYNRADAYVIAVGHLADRLRGFGPLQGTWPTDERALTFDERMELQQRLTDAGYSTLGIDGIIGPDTINATRSYQQANGLVPDGYPGIRLLTHLRDS